MAVRAVRGATQVERDHKEHVAPSYLHGTELLRAGVPTIPTTGREEDAP